MLINSMMEENTLGELSTIIVDELHMVRGVWTGVRMQGCLYSELGYNTQMQMRSCKASIQRFRTACTACLGSSCSAYAGGSAPYAPAPAARCHDLEANIECICSSDWKRKPLRAPHFQVGEEDRGYLLELLLTKLRYITAEGGDVDWEDAPPHFVRDGLQV